MHKIAGNSMLVCQRTWKINFWRVRENFSMLQAVLKKNSWNCCETKLKILRMREYDFFLWQGKSLTVQHGSAKSKRNLRFFIQNENFHKSNYDLFRPTLGVTALFSNDTMRFYYIENAFLIISLNSLVKNSFFLHIKSL